MNRIPTELLHKILIKLGLRDKLECMLVCRFWYDTLDRSGLLDTLNINNHAFLKLKEMIERQPHRANQVEILKLSLNSSTDFDKRTLCNMFPNLREIALRESDDIETSYSDSPFQFTHATSKLEKIVEYVDCALISQLAMSNMCSRLKTLDLTCDENSNNVFTQLKNMPVLDTLTLADFKLKLSDLEMVHSNIPSIKRLNLAFLTILAGEIPQHVVPATLVTNLDVYYLAKKYPSVTKPNCDDETLTDADEDYIKDVYNKGIFPCYQKIGTQIDTFSFDSYCVGLDAFRKFDEFGIKLKHLELRSWEMDEPLCIQELVFLQQARYIETLMLTDVVPSPLDRLILMDTLTHLEIDFQTIGGEDERRIKMKYSHIVEACPRSLMNLTIKGVNLLFRRKSINEICVQSLKLIDVEITGKAEITDFNFPDLSVLHLRVTLKQDLAISFPYNHLKDVAIDVEYPQRKNCTLALNTIHDGKRQCRLITTDKSSAADHSDDDPFSESKPVTVNLTCASIGQLSYSVIEKEEDSDYDEFDDSDDYDDEYDLSDYEGYGFPDPGHFGDIGDVDYGEYDDDDDDDEDGDDNDDDEDDD